MDPDLPKYTREAFEAGCERYGFKPTDYERPFDDGPDFAALIGFNPRARRFFCVGRNAAGTIYFYDPAFVHEQFKWGNLHWEPDHDAR